MIIFLNRPYLRILSILVFISLFVIGLFSFFPIIFETNDDLAMLVISSGIYSGSPDEHLIFMNVLIGFFLKFLYQKTTNIEWYSIFFILMNIISSVVILNKIVFYGLHNGKIGKFIVAISVVIFLVFEFNFIANIQFTTLAAIVVSASIILISEKDRVKIFFGIFLMLIGFAIRFHAGVLVLAISIPYIVASSEINTKKISLFIFIIFLIASMNFFDSYYYNRSVEWSYYSDYNYQRGRINDNPNAYRLIFPKMKDQNNYQFLLDFMPDPSVLNLEKLIFINSKINQTGFFVKFNNVKKQILRFKIFIIPLFLLFVYLAYSSSYINKIVILSGLGMQLFLICFLSVDGALKERVFFSSVFPILFVYYPYLIDNSFKLFPAIFFVFSIIYSFKIISITVDNMAKAENKQHTLSQQMELIKKYKNAGGRDLVCYGADYLIEALNPLSAGKRLRPASMYFTGWFSGIPFKGQLVSFTEFLETKAIFIKKKNAINVLPMVLSSIQENYGIKTAYRVAIQSKDYSIIECYPIKP